MAFAIAAQPFLRRHNIFHHISKSHRSHQPLSPPSRCSRSLIMSTTQSPPKPISTPSEEYFDILDSTGKSLNLTKPRSQVHRDGDWHATVHIWLLNSRNQLLLQKRSATKDTFPGRWDVSAAGHISSGHSAYESAIRELEEELSLDKEKDNFELEFLFQVCSSNSGTAGKDEFLDNEIQNVFVVRKDFKVEEMELEEGEIDEIKYFDYREYRDGQEREDHTLVPRPLQYQERLFTWLERQKSASE